MFTEPVVLWAIRSDGNVGGLLVGTDGRLSAAESDERFLGYCPPSGMIPERYEQEARRRVEAHLDKTLGVTENERMVR